MTETEVLAIEVKQYVDESGTLQTIVPRVIGQTEAARHAKHQGTGREWDRDTILAELRNRCGFDEARVAERIFDWVDARGDLRRHYGSGSKDGSFQAGLYSSDAYLFPFVMYTYGRLEIQFQFIRRRPPFDDPALRDELRGKLDAVPGVAMSPDVLERRPSIPFAALTDDETLNRVLEVLDWAFAQSERAASADAPEAGG
jgi:hypothetical protein